MRSSTRFKASQPYEKAGKSVLNSQERVKTAIRHQEPDRVPMHDGFWQATIDRWRDEGLPANMEPTEYFDFDFVSLGGFDLSPGFAVKVLREDTEYIVETDEWGGIRRNHKDRATTPEIIDSPIKSKDDWFKMKPRLKAGKQRVNWPEIRKQYQNARAREKYVVMAHACGYDLLQYFMTSEQLLLTMAEDPAWVKDMVDTLSVLITETLAMMYDDGVHFDALWVCNDMGYRNGCLFSPQMYRDILAPSDRLRNQWCHEHNLQTILHSCGRVKELIGDLVDAGFDCLQALEAKAGMDVRELKATFGNQIAFFGNINVMLMEDPDDNKIENEIREKLAVAMPGGGYLFSSDHSIPKDVSFQKYQYIVECVRRYGRYDNK